MARILGIQGSPRKNGNTQILVERVLEGARDAGATTRMIQLGDMTIAECDGCHACWKGKECPKDDDMNAVYTTIAESDAIVFGTPVYWFGPTALLKSFIDRFVYFNCPENRAKARGKRAALIVPFEDTDLETAAPLVKMVEMSLDYVEMTLLDPLLVPGVGTRGAVLEHPDQLHAAHVLGRRLAS
ncbi:MAG: flavodoxin family protein [Verrucomicrobia bacterium]|nr:flavodoxin family protein [Verrucomicrobiota bacterium]